MKILLDTNFLMMPHQFGVDIFEFLKDYEMLTLSSCVEELRKLSKKRGDDGKAAKIALKLVKDRGIEVAKTKEKGDRAILVYALREKCTVGTNDIGLMKSLKNGGIKIIRLRQKKYLEEC